MHSLKIKKGRGGVLFCCNTPINRPIYHLRICSRLFFSQSRVDITTTDTFNFWTQIHDSTTMRVGWGYCFVLAQWEEVKGDVRVRPSTGKRGSKIRGGRGWDGYWIANTGSEHQKEKGCRVGGKKGMEWEEEGG